MEGQSLAGREMREATMADVSPASHLTEKLGQVTVLPFQDPSNPSTFQKLLEDQNLSLSSTNDFNFDVDMEKDFILSQDFFCTPDYITPDGQQISNSFDFNKEDLPCPRSPEKSKTIRSKRHRQEGILVNSVGSTLPCNQQAEDLMIDCFDYDEEEVGKSSIKRSPSRKSYVSQSAVALRCRVMPPPCVKNPYLNDNEGMDFDTFGNRRSKSTGFSPSIVGGDGVSRYRTDFHEIEQIGSGNFSHVFKVLKRIDGCMYAVKHSIRQLHQDTERRRALMEVQALAALGYHENVVSYYTSWFENEQLYIQMELCDRSLSFNAYSRLSTEEILKVMYEISRALQFIHERGIAHLDVKPDNIYRKNGVFKLGDFGCATLINGTLPIEEGDARYMPQEILNEKYEHLDKVDIFSLGTAIYELLKGSPLPESGPQFLNLREGKMSLLPGQPMQLQNLLKAMMDPDPVRRPSAMDLIGNPIFERAHLTARTK